MLAILLVAATLAPWLHPVAFAPLQGWNTGASGNTTTLYGGPAGGTESAAWIAKNVTYRDKATADPPNATLAHLASSGVIVWAVTYSPAHGKRQPIPLDLGGAKRFDCCEATFVPGGEYELSGAGPRGKYSVIVRIYFGSRPTAATRAAAQTALTHLRLPVPR